MGDLVCMDGGMFPEPARAPAPRDTRTPGQRRRDRQRAAIDLGQHPLAAALRVNIPLHDDVIVSHGAETTGPTCGGCAFRQRVSGGNKSFPKCTARPVERSRTDEHGQAHRWQDYPRATHGAGTDVQASWPACTDHQPLTGDETS